MKHIVLVTAGLMSLVAAGPGRAERPAAPPMPADLEAAREKMMDARVAAVRAENAFRILQQKYEREKIQAWIADARKRGDTNGIAAARAELAALDKEQALDERMLPIKYDMIAAQRAQDRARVKADRDRLTELQQQMDLVWRENPAVKQDRPGRKP